MIRAIASNEDAPRLSRSSSWCSKRGDPRYTGRQVWARTDRGVDGARRTRWESDSVIALSPGDAGSLRVLWSTDAQLVDVVGGQPVRLGWLYPPDRRRRAA